MTTLITENSQKERPLDKADTLEAAASDVSLALTFLAAAERFGDDVRQMLENHGDASLKALVMLDLKRADTLLFEARSKLEESMGKIDLVIDAENEISRVSAQAA